MRYQFIDADTRVYPIVLICNTMRVSRSGYYSWRSREKSARQLEHEELIPIVKEAARESRGTYGTRRIVEELKSRGHSCGRDKARRLMKLAGVSIQRRKKFKVTTDSKHKLPVCAERCKYGSERRSREIVRLRPASYSTLDIRGLVVSRGCTGFVSEEDCGLVHESSDQ